MTPIDPEPVDPIIDPASEPSPEGGADSAPAAAAVPVEDEPIEEVLWRFVEENGWLPKPRPPLPPRPPEPKSIHQMTPEEMHESLPVHLRRQRPDGTYYAMGLISRMQQDLEDLTQGKRAATYPEVDEYLGYALLAEGLAPRELSAPDAVKWWRAGGSEVLSERPTMAAVPASDDIGNSPITGLQKAAFDGRSFDTGHAATSWTDASSMAGSRIPTSETGFVPKGSLAGELAAYGEQIAGGASPPQAAPVKKPKKQPEKRPAAPLGTDLSTYDTGFGDRAHAFHGDYRTTPAARAWLTGLERLAGPSTPYPDGLPGNEKLTISVGRKIRENVGYLYTLPEVKAFLDLISRTEGTEKYGYYHGHDDGKQRSIPDLTTFHGGAPSGRYQIERKAWKNFGGAWWSRTDFSEITQDLIAITMLRQWGAIDELMKGNLSGALTKASEVFASIPLSLKDDHSFYEQDYGVTKIDPKTGRRIVSPPQFTPVAFRDLPANFERYLKYRKAEFSAAQQAWETKKIIPKAFISPLKWRSFGLDGF